MAAEPHGSHMHVIIHVSTCNSTVYNVHVVESRVAAHTVCLA
jgi:hypothetical protein